MKLAHFNQAHYWPHCHSTHASLQGATKFKLCMESLLSVPKSAIFDGAVGYGGGTGVGGDLPRKAYGEFVERNHLFTRVPKNSKKKLADIKPSAYRDKLLTLCHLDKVDKDACYEHAFQFTNVKNLFTDVVYEYFYNSISLHGVKEDRPYLNFSDSCACAAHPIKEKALHNSLLEFLERQALVGSWMSKTYQYTINPELLRSLTPYTQLADRLLDNGEVYIVENGNKLPGHTVIIFYFSKSPKDAVQYSIGSSSGLTLQEALTSALVELYQCYSFLYNQESSNGLENKAGAGYHISFQGCNHQGIRETIPFLSDFKPYEINTLQDAQACKRYEIQDVIDELGHISQDIFYYDFYEPTVGLHITKVMSPDFFSHMSLSNYINFNNEYCKLMNIDKETAFLGKIPFP